MDDRAIFVSGSDFEWKPVLVKTDASTNPTEPGCYVCWLFGAKSPVVLYRSGHECCWRKGAMKVRVVAWMGPLPE